MYVCIFISYSDLKGLYKYFIILICKNNYEDRGYEFVREKAELWEGLKGEKGRRLIF